MDFCERSEIKVSSCEAIMRHTWVEAILSLRKFIRYRSVLCMYVYIYMYIYKYIYINVYIQDNKRSDTLDT